MKVDLPMQASPLAFSDQYLCLKRLKVALGVWLLSAEPISSDCSNLVSFRAQALSSKSEDFVSLNWWIALTDAS